MSKKGGGDSGSAKDYWGSIAALICAGPVSELVSIVNDGHTIWPQTTKTAWASGVVYDLGDILSHVGRIWRSLIAHTSSAANAPGLGSANWTEQIVKRTDPGVGNPYVFDYQTHLGRTSKIIFYWGEDAQDISTAAGDPRFSSTHPNYRRQCFVILVDWLFGRERVTAPSLSFVVRRRARQTLLPAVAALDPEGQANPLAAEVELLTDPTFGLGQPVALLDPTSLGNEAAALQANTPLYYLSPFLDSTRSGRSFIAESLLYRDGWFRLNAAGLIEAGHFSHAEAPPAFTAANTIDVNDLEDDPQFQAEGWGETTNVVSVTYRDRSEAYRETSAEAGSGWNLAVTGTDTTEKLDRLWIERADQAGKFASELSKVLAEPDLSGTLIVRAPKVANLKVGDLFLFTHDAVQLSVICRVMERTVESPPADRVSLRFQRERGLAVVPYVQGAVPQTEASYPDPEKITYYRLVQFAPSLSGLEDSSISVLAARTNPLTIGLRLHLRKDDGSGFLNLGTQIVFAVTGTLTQAYPATLPPEPSVATDPPAPPDDVTETLRFIQEAGTPAIDAEKITAGQTADAVNDNRLLLIAFTATGTFEIMTAISIRPVSGAYYCKVRRARFGTKRLAFASLDRVWVISRLGLRFYEHASFPDYQKSGTPVVFRLQSFNAGKEANLADTTICPDITYAFADNYAPVINWLNVRKDGVEVTDFTLQYPVSNTVVWTFVVEATDADNDASQVAITAGISGKVRTLLSEQITPATGSLSRSTLAKFEDEGDVIIMATVTDLAGRTTTKQLTNAGVPVILRITVAGKNRVATPTVNWPSGAYTGDTIMVTPSCATAGAAMFFQMVPLGKVPGASWTAYTAGSGPFPIFPPKSLWLYATKPGMDDSIHQEYRYTKV